MSGVVLPWPPSSLSGHNNGNRYKKADIIADHRNAAKRAAEDAKLQAPDDGDILIAVEFYPPNKRSDRINLWNRCKPYFDGIADAMGVNDKRFTPAADCYRIRECVPGGRVAVIVNCPKPD